MNVRQWWSENPRRMLLRLLPAAGRGRLVLLALLVLAGPPLQLAFSLATGRLIAAVPGAVAGGFESRAGRALTGALVVLAVAFVLQYLLGGVREVLSFTLGRRVDRQLRARVLEATLGPPGVAHVEDPEVLDRIEIATAKNTGMTAGGAATAIVQVVTNRLSVLSPALILASFRWWLPVVVGGALVWVRVVMRNHILLSVRASMAQTPALRRSQYFVDLALRPEAAKETRVFGLDGWIGHRFEGYYLTAMREVWRERRASQRKLIAPIVAMFATSLAAYLLVVDAALRGEVGIGRLTILVAAVSGMRAVLALGNEDVMLEQGVAGLPTLLEVEAQLAERAESLTGTAPATDLPRSHVRFEGVGFRYPRTERPVYESLDLEIRAGQSLAVVGVNGAGKTTLVKLLARLHDPTAGRITVDDVDLREIDPDQWQRRVAAIFQDFTRYELSAADNIGFGALDLRGDVEQLDAAARSAGADDIVDRLPEGWGTVLSRRFSGGTDLSGGQWQRVALARALLAVRGGAGILVLDEPTANLDVRAEAELYDRFLEITRGVTSVVISHRFSTVRRADRIVVIDAGRVVEDGTHAELVAADGIYARMFRLQAARFEEPAGA